MLHCLQESVLRGVNGRAELLDSCYTAFAVSSKCIPLTSGKCDVVCCNIGQLAVCSSKGLPVLAVKQV